ncbi:MAG: ATP synthase F1 subunit epsilon [Planctomycetes bacterium]|nr:ATP synthase F1 subunit epsilon [Planctomycetota bacterium]
MANELRLTIITPEEVVFDDSVDSVVATSETGEVGFLKGHAPFIGALGYGELRATKAGKIERFFIGGGFVEVIKNVVTVLSDEAVSSSEIVVDDVTQKLAAARTEPSKTEEQRVRKEREIAKLKGMLVAKSRM